MSPMIYFLSFSLLFVIAIADPHFVDVRCIDTAGSYTEQSIYQTNLNSLLLSLDSATENFFYCSNQTGDSPETTAYGFYYCRGDIGPKDCQACVDAAAKKAVASCQNLKEVVVWYGECTLRYANRAISSIMEEEPWVSKHGGANGLSSDQFAQSVTKGLETLIMAAAYNYSSTKFYGLQKTVLASGQQQLDTLVQCDPGIGSGECESCLRKMSGDISSCCGLGSAWASIFSPSCELIYSLTSIAKSAQQAPSTSSSSTGNMFKTVIISISAVVAGMCLLITIWCCLYNGNTKIIDGPMPMSELPSPPPPGPYD